MLQQQVCLQDGSRLGYDRLLIATGASARKLSTETDTDAIKSNGIKDSTAVKDANTYKV